MRETGIQARRKQGYKCIIKHNLARPVVPNLLAQDFRAEAINEIWIADITYIDTHEGWLYLAAILDVYSHEIVGWSMRTRL